VIKWNRAKKGLEETGSAYEKLTVRLDYDWIHAWTEQAETAAVEGGDSLKIYNVDVEHGEVILT
jgi:hypothetical protein